MYMKEGKKIRGGEFEFDMTRGGCDYKGQYENTRS